MEALLNKIEAYGFECQGGPLVNCQHWQDLRALAAAPQAPSGQQVVVGLPAFDDATPAPQDTKGADNHG